MCFSHFLFYKGLSRFAARFENKQLISFRRHLFDKRALLSKELTDLLPYYIRAVFFFAEDRNSTDFFFAVEDTNHHSDFSFFKEIKSAWFSHEDDRSKTPSNEFLP
jgi:hypothetical protein